MAFSTLQEQKQWIIAVETLALEGKLKHFNTFEK